MNKIIPLLALTAALTGCVTYYYPAPEATADGIYYAEEDPAYTDYSASVATSAYYPWWSLDYFYLGYGFGSSRLSLGLGYGFDPWYGYYHPYYSYFYYPPFRSVWYPPYYHHHHYYSVWLDPYWHYKYDRYHHYSHPRHRDRYVDEGHSSYRGAYRQPPQRLPRDPRGPDRPPTDYEDRYTARGDAYVPGLVNRVAAGPTRGAAGDPMRVRSRSDAKPGRSRLHPASDLPQPVVIAEDGRRAAPAAPREDSRRIISRSPASGAGSRNVVVRSRGDSKARRERLEPVIPSPAPSRDESDRTPSTAPARGAGTFSVISRPRPAPSEREASAVRFREAARPGASQTEPVRRVAPQVVTPGSISRGLSRPVTAPVFRAPASRTVQPAPVQLQPARSLNRPVLGAPAPTMVIPGNRGLVPAAPRPTVPRHAAPPRSQPAPVDSTVPRSPQRRER